MTEPRPQHTDHESSSHPADVVEIPTDDWPKDLAGRFSDAQHHLAELAADNTAPDPHVATDFMYYVAENGNTTPDILSQYVRVTRQIIDKTNEIFDSRGETDRHISYGSILTPLSSVDEQTLQIMLGSPELSADTEYILENTPGQTVAMGLILTKAYGNTSMLDLADPNNVAFDDPIAAQLRSRLDFIAAVASELRRDEPWRQATTPQEISHLKRFWADRFLEYVGKMPPTLRYNLLFDSISRVAADDDPTLINDTRLELLLVNTAANIQAITIDNARLLYEKAGIVNFDHYEADQLLLTALFAAGNKETIEHLQAGDVTVVFTNAKDDYSGALVDTAHMFRTPNSRTLFFEVSNLEDMLGYLELLKQNSIKPSTVVYSDHGLPNGFNARLSSANVFVTHNTLGIPTPDSKPKAPLQDFPEIGALVEEYMQDSRGIDDPPEAIGTRRIIMAACYLAKRTHIIRRRYGHEPPDTTSPEDRIIAHESLIESLARIINRTGVIIYGGDSPFALDRKNETLYLYDTTDTGQRTELPITSVRIDEHGNLVTETLVNLQLSKHPANPHQEEES